MNLIAVLIFLTLIVQITVAVTVKNILKQVKIARELSELTEQLRRKTDALEVAINNQTKKTK